MAVGIGIGLSRFPFDTAREYWRWVEQCETGQVDSIWQTDRLVSSEPMLEVLATMAALAGATERTRFGMNVASIALRDPLVTAKQCATIDFLSNGRMLPAFGLGSMRSADYAATGTPTARRGKRANEALELMARLWTESSVTFEGDFYQYQDAMIEPKPANPHIPLWIGGSSEVAMRRTARYGTGWLGGLDTPEQAAVMVSGIREKLAEYGRNIDDDHYGATFSYFIGNEDAEAADDARRSMINRLKKDPSPYMAVGDASEVIARIEAFRDAGCSKFVLMPMGRGWTDISEQTRLLIEQVLPEYEGQ